MCNVLNLPEGKKDNNLMEKIIMVMLALGLKELYFGFKFH